MKTHLTNPNLYLGNWLGGAATCWSVNNARYGSQRSFSYIPLLLLLYYCDHQPPPDPTPAGASLKVDTSIMFFQNGIKHFYVCAANIPSVSRNSEKPSKAVYVPREELRSLKLHIIVSEANANDKIPETVVDMIILHMKYSTRASDSRFVGTIVSL